MMNFGVRKKRERLGLEKWNVGSREGQPPHESTWDELPTCLIEKTSFFLFGRFGISSFLIFDYFA